MLEEILILFKGDAVRYEIIRDNAKIKAQGGSYSGLNVKPHHPL